VLVQDENVDGFKVVDQVVERGESEAAACEIRALREGLVKLGEDVGGHMHSRIPVRGQVHCP
jgi:hypothetical protein